MTARCEDGRVMITILHSNLLIVTLLPVTAYPEVTEDLSPSPGPEVH